MTKVFIIIITYNGIKWYDKCFSSLQKSSIPLKIIVVDNASADGSVEYIRNNFPETIVLESKDNLGFGQGNNLAFRYALEHNADYVFLLNQDTWLIDNNTIEELINISKSHPEYGILSPMHLRANMKELGMLWENGNNFCSKQLVSDLFCGTLKDVYETNYVNAAAWLLPRKTLETVGGFDPIYKHYEEDDDYLNRTKFHGFKIGVCPSARIVHDHQKSTINPFESHNRYHHNQDILVKLTNINDDITIFNFLKYCIRKLIIFTIKGKFSSAHSYAKDIVFIIKQRKRVLESRKKNAIQARTWI